MAAAKIDLERQLAVAADAVSASEAWLAMATGISRLEIECVSALLSHPWRGLSIARSIGFSSQELEQEDVSLIYQAAELLEARSLLPPLESFAAREMILRLARRALMHFGYWDQAALPGSRGLLWNDLSLVNLASTYPGPLALSALVARLRKLVARAADADAHLRHCRRILDTHLPRDYTPMQLARQLVQTARLSGIPPVVLSAYSGGAA